MPKMPCKRPCWRLGVVYPAMKDGLPCEHGCTGSPPTAVLTGFAMVAGGYPHPSRCRHSSRPNRAAAKMRPGSSHIPICCWTTSPISLLDRTSATRRGRPWSWRSSRACRTCRPGKRPPWCCARFSASPPPRLRPCSIPARSQSKVCCAEHGLHSMRGALLNRWRHRPILIRNGNWPGASPTPSPPATSTASSRYSPTTHGSACRPRPTSTAALLRSPRSCASPWHGPRDGSACAQCAPIPSPHSAAILSTRRAWPSPRG